MTSTSESGPVADAALLAARDIALAALHEITPADTVGPPAGHTVEADGSVSLLFENRLPGYPGWYWTATIARVDDAEPTVLETELMPGGGALLAPEWVPWVERLAEYRAHQAELASQGDDSSDDDDDDDDDDDLLDDGEPDAIDYDELDGVDIDELDDSNYDDSDDSDDASDDEEE